MTRLLGHPYFIVAVVSIAFTLLPACALFAR